jgi:ABC-type antimicrobial peptide transport system ATPase subunit
MGYHCISENGVRYYWTGEAMEVIGINRNNGKPIFGNQIRMTDVNDRQYAVSDDANRFKNIWKRFDELKKQNNNNRRKLIENDPSIILSPNYSPLSDRDIWKQACRELCPNLTQIPSQSLAT